MADPVATVGKIVKIGLKIKDAVDTVRHNEEDCHEIRRRVLRFSAILSELQQTGMMNNSPAMSSALEETLQHALELVTACQERTTIRRLVTAGELSKKLRRAKDDILNKVMLASFALNAHTTIVLLTIQAGGHPLLQQPEDSRLVHVSRAQSSAEDARFEMNGKEVLTGSDSPFAPLVALRNFTLSELKAAISGGDIIGKGCFWNIYKLQHTNIVKVLGYGCDVLYRKKDREVRSSSVIMRLLKRKKDEAQEEEYAQEGEYVWVEEYVPNGSLDMVIRESQLDWPSLSRVIDGVAQGIHYLHEQHAVHMDVKPSNILLDSDMNPKITDFDLSIVLEDEEIMEYRIQGTFGYMPREYASRGIVSFKNDVYGFGVTLLATIGSMFRLDPPFLNYSNANHQWESIVKVIINAWSACHSGRMEELFDPSLFDGSDQLMEMKRCTQVALLCIQDDRADRPTMADILEMLHGEKDLPTPKKPAFFCTNSSDEEEESVEERPDSPSAWSGGSLSPR